MDASGFPSGWSISHPVLMAGMESWNGVEWGGRDLKDPFTPFLPRAGTAEQLFQEWVNQIIQAPGQSCPSSLGMAAGNQGESGQLPLGSEVLLPSLCHVAGEG